MTGCTWNGVPQAAEERRLALFSVTPQLMLDALCLRNHDFGPRHFKINGLPEGYELVDVSYDFSGDAFVFKVAHESFPITVPGAKLPFLHVTFTTRDAPAAPWSCPTCGASNKHDNARCHFCKVSKKTS